MLTLNEKVRGSFISAAVGDALGWPNEDRSNRVRRNDRPATDGGFSFWTKRKGWMAQTFEEPIEPGGYSDDTQLILASARSLTYELWWNRFSEVELPNWLIYERGGGVAIKRAARCWASGKAPWGVEKEKSQYWEAGGNGVCMRILPHVVRGQAGSFQEVADEIFRNGVTTHGHPRALVGALLYGFALWLSFQQEDILEFGRLLQALLTERWQWGDFPRSFFDVPGLADSVTGGAASYKQKWKLVVNEATDLLEIANKHIGKGALEMGDEALREIGAFSKNIGGAGTVTSCAAIFLASRYAASPKQGLRFSASLVGSDSDTIASMTGAILGALHGVDFLQNLGPKVQDADYINSIARALFTTATKASYKRAPQGMRVSRQQIITFNRKLKSSEIGQALEMPDSRMAIVKNISDLNSRRGKAYLWKLLTSDGQTLFVSAMDRSSGDKEIEPHKNSSIYRDLKIMIYADDLEKAQDFYENKLCLRLTKRSSSHLEFIGLLEIRKPQNLMRRLSNSAIPQLSLTVDDIRVIYAQMKERSIPTSTVKISSEGIGVFTICDPFDNAIEFRGKTN